MKDPESKGKVSLGSRPLACPSPVWVVCTYDSEGEPNAMTASWAGICCSKPPCVQVSLRKATYTYGNILARQAFSVNIPSIEQARISDYFGIVSGAEVKKISYAGLDPVPCDKVDAPMVMEFPLSLECSLIKTLELGLHTLFVGEVIDVKASRDVIGEDGRPDMGLLRPFTYSAGDSRYYATGEVIGDAFTLGNDFEKDH